MDDRDYFDPHAYMGGQEQHSDVQFMPKAIGHHHDSSEDHDIEAQELMPLRGAKKSSKRATPMKSKPTHATSSSTKQQQRPPSS
jgi:hypothetical protein